MKFKISLISICIALGVLTSSAAPVNSGIEIRRGGGSGSGLSASSVSTNTLIYTDSVIRSKMPLPSYYVWDNFDREVPLGVGIPGLTSSGHTLKAAGDTNAMVISGGRFYIGANTNSAVYLSYSNNQPSTISKAATKLSGKLSFRDRGAGGGFSDVLSVILSATTAEGGIGGNFLHTVISPTGITVQRSLGSTILQQAWILDSSLSTLTVYDFDLTIISNSIFVTCGPYKYTAYASDLSTYAVNPVATFECFGSTTNQYNGSWHSMNIGNIEAFQYSTDKIKLTNNIDGERFVDAVLVNGSYTNQNNDRIIGFTVAGTNRLISAEAYPGVTVKVIDFTGNAASAPIYIATSNGETIDGGPTVTNINKNNAMMELVSDTVGWRIVGSHLIITGGGGTPVGIDGSLQYANSSAFYGTNKLVYEQATGTLINSNSSGAALLLKGNNTQLLLEAGGSGASSIFTTNASNLRLGTSNTASWLIRGTGSGLNNPGDIVPSGNTLNIGEFPGSAITSGQIANLNAQSVRAYLFSNVVYSIPGDTSVITVYGSNQFWRANITSNITFADNALGSNIVYWIKVTNNTSTVAFPGSWRWIDGPSLTTAPSLQTGEYIVRVQKFDNATNAWVETGPTVNFVAGPGLALTTNGNTVTINQNTFQTLAYSTFTNCIFDMSLGYNGSLTMTNNVLFGQPTNLRAGADFKIYVAQNSVGTWNWWFDTNYWTFNVFPYLPIETNANRVSVLSGFVNPAGTKLIVMQATDFRP